VPKTGIGQRHSMTSSAISCIALGTVIPSAGSSEINDQPVCFLGAAVASPGPWEHTTIAVADEVIDHGAAEARRRLEPEPSSPLAAARNR
jgi:hypothetical protein